MVRRNNNGDLEETATDESIDEPMHPTGNDKGKHDRPARLWNVYRKLDGYAAQKQSRSYMI